MPIRTYTQGIELLTEPVGELEWDDFDELVSSSTHTGLYRWNYQQLQQLLKYISHHQHLKIEMRLHDCAITTSELISIINHDRVDYINIISNQNQICQQVQLDLLLLLESTSKRLQLDKVMLIGSDFEYLQQHYSDRVDVYSNCVIIESD